MLKKVVDARYTLWLLLALPGAAMVVGYATGRIYYGEFLHMTGEFSARLLIATLAITPLAQLWRAGWTRWLVQRRRYVGVACFGYAVAHVVPYLDRMGSVGRVLQDAAEPGLWTGWLALAVLTALAVTSNDTAVRRLGAAWKRLHRWVYAAAALTIAHWLLVAFDPTSAWIHGAVIVALEGLRLATRRRAVRP